MALGPGDDVEGGAGLVLTMHACHNGLNFAGLPGRPHSVLRLIEHGKQVRMHPYGLHFAIGLQPSPTLTPHDRHLLETLNPAGIILFRDNFEHGGSYETWLTALRTLLDDARTCIGRERILIGIDHEGGRVIRTPPPVTHYAYAREWAPYAADVGRAMAIELRSLGMNLMFAPVVDIHSNPDNPVIGPRALGTDAAGVTAAALAFMRAAETEGMMTCPKHFPGHGETAVDSHHGLPVVEYDLDALRRRELRPFKATIDAGARLVMTSHILFPNIDGDIPATMSSRLIRDVLRAELGFNGVIITDDIGMGAVRDMFSQHETVERMMNATTDLIDICAYGTDTARALQIADFIAEGVKAGRIAARTMEASAARMNNLLEDLPQYAVEALPAEVFERHATLAPLHDPASPGSGTWQKKQ